MFGFPSKPSADPRGRIEPTIGAIADVDLSSGQEIWRIATPDNKEILFPAVPEFVAELDARTRTARISPPPGLLEIYL